MRGNIIFPSEKIFFTREKGLNVLSISGGGTKIIGQEKACQGIIRKYGFKPDLIVGVSSGAVLSLPIAMGKWEELKTMMDSLSMKSIFDKCPITKKNRVSVKGIIRALTGKPSLGTMKNLAENIKKVISESEFEQYKRSVSLPICVIMAYDFKKAKRVFINLKEVSYSEYLKFVTASASLPIAAEPLESNNMVLVDGGVVNTSIANWAMENFDVKKVVSVFSSPKEEDISDTTWEAKNVLNVWSRLEEILCQHSHHCDHLEEQRIAQDKGIIYKPIFLPKVLTSTFDVDKDRLEEFAKQSEIALHNQYLND